MAERPKGEQDREGIVWRRGRAAAVGADASLTAAAAFQRAGFRDPSLVLHWTQIVGPEVSHIARPIRFSEKDGLLTVLAEPAAALFLGHDSRSLADRINAYLGRPAVRRIKIVQGALRSRAAPAALARPNAVAASDPSHGYRGPERLKTALQSLARWRTRPKPADDLSGDRSGD